MKGNTRVKTKGENSKRTASVTFFLFINGEKLKVCKIMFLNTLGLEKGVVDIALQKRTLQNTTTVDRRGKHFKKVTNQSVIDNIKMHIESFPSVPSHYCRVRSKPQYLCSSLNVTTMYSLYRKRCEDEGKTMASEAIYRKVFNENYNLGFHRPRKDQCRICVAYHNAPDNDKKTLESEFRSHIRAKDLARSEKRLDKFKADGSNGEFVLL